MLWMSVYKMSEFFFHISILGVWALHTPFVCLFTTIFQLITRHNYRLGGDPLIILINNYYYSVMYHNQELLLFGLSLFARCSWECRWFLSLNLVSYYSYVQCQMLIKKFVIYGYQKYTESCSILSLCCNHRVSPEAFTEHRCWLESYWLPHHTDLCYILKLIFT